MVSWCRSITTLVNQPDDIGVVNNLRTQVYDHVGGGLVKYTMLNEPLSGGGQQPFTTNPQGSITHFDRRRLKIELFNACFQNARQNKREYLKSCIQKFNFERFFSHFHVTTRFLNIKNIVAQIQNVILFNFCIIHFKNQILFIFV